MTRNEQILSEVQKRFSSNDTHLVSKISTFIDGAKWADEYPKHGTVNKQEFIAKTISYFTPILKTYCSEECVKELIDGFVNSLGE